MKKENVWIDPRNTFDNFLLNKILKKAPYLGTIYLYNIENKKIIAALNQKIELPKLDMKPYHINMKTGKATFIN